MNHYLTPYIYIVIFLLPFSGILAQQNKLEIKFNSKTPSAQISNLQSSFSGKTKDSVGVALKNVLQRMEQMGFLSARVDSIIKADSLETAYISTGEQVKSLLISYAHIPELLKYQKELKRIAPQTDDDHILIDFSDLPDFMDSLVQLIENNGHTFVKIYLDPIELIQGQARAMLRFDQTAIRHIDKVIVRGYENFPKNYIDQELQLKVGSVFKREMITYVSKAVNNLTFAEEHKPPKVLFTKDSTIIYLYLNKKKSNQFDGILGFASKEEESGLEFNGYLDLSMNNIFNSGETIALFWKSNGQNRQRFYIEAEAPYLFNIPMTPKVNFELYRQDSTFNNTEAQISLAYHLKGKGQVAAQLNTESSNDLTDGSSSGISSFTSRFYGLSYSFRLLSRDPVFPTRFMLHASGLLGSRKNNQEQIRQSKWQLHVNYLYALNDKHYIFLQNSSGMLNSNNYLINELFRIGGINNLRGVNEESIFVTAYSVFNLEYRFKPNPLSYFYSITDFAFTGDDLYDQQSNIWSLGLGYAFKTKAGFLNISYAIGKFENTPFSFDNSRIHLKMVSKF